MRFHKLFLWLALAAITGCGVTDDLLPSGKDMRGESRTLAPGDMAPQFAMPDIWGASHTLAGELAGRRGVVMYFAMWCPICDSHMQSILRNVLPKHPDVAFLIVDYVTGTVEGAQRAAQAGGYAQSAYTILVDQRQDALLDYGATMGTTVVVDSGGVIRMIEDYRGEARLDEALAGL
ncbi:MAG: TlpA family protein disulfide reductase [Nitrospinota bacterium]|nr:TlpA family protein disulfide reductase [Nitrospinota bacterium]